MDGEPGRQAATDRPPGPPPVTAAGGTGGPGRGRASAPGTPGLLAIRVLAAEDGRPLGGAEIVVTGAAGAVHRASADAAGRAKVEGLEHPSSWIEAKFPGRVRSRAPAPRTADDAPVTLWLDRGVVLGGMVTDENGAVAGATVRAYGLDAWKKSVPYGGGREPFETVTTDASGTYEIDCVPLELACALVASAPGHAAAWAETDPMPGPEFTATRGLQLRTALRVSGTVRIAGPDGSMVPAAGAAVWIADEGQLPPRAASLPRFSPGDLDDLRFLEQLASAHVRPAARPWMATTDAAGEFSVDVPMELAAVRAMAFRAGDGRSSATAGIAPGRRFGDLDLRGRAESSFEVTASTGGPAEDVRIGSSLPWESWTAGPRGRGRYGPVTCDRGPILCRVSGGTDAPGTYYGRSHDERSLVWTVQLHSGRTVRGRVRGTSGEAVAGARVTAGSVSGETSVSGVYELHGVRVNEKELSVSAEGYSTMRVELEGEGDQTVDVRLPLGFRIQLQLELPGGDEAPNWVRVWIGPSQSSKGAGRVLPTTPWNYGRVFIPDANVTDDRLVVVVPGYEIEQFDVKPDPGEVVDLGERRLDRLVGISATLTDESGTRVPGARVTTRVTRAEPWVRMVPEQTFVADAAGRVALETWVRGMWGGGTAVVAAPGFAQTPNRLGKYDSEVTLFVGRGRTLNVRIPGSGPQWAPHSCRATGFGDVELGTARFGIATSVTFRVPLLPRLVEILDRGGRSIWSGVPAATPNDTVDFEVTLPEPR